MKVLFKRLMTTATAVAAFAGMSTAALAAESGIENWQLGFQASVSEVMDDITWFNNFTLVIITVITLFVLGLLIYCAVKFSSKNNPVPSRTSHNTMIEVVWTVVPILILVVIAIPSFRLLYKQLDIPEYEMTVKAVGYQWYWGYEYTDENMNELYFDSYMVGDAYDADADLAARTEFAEARGVSVNEVPRLLAVDYEMVVPVDTTVRLQVTAADVIHAFAMPSMGLKIDAIPGRLNETWFRAREEGIYYGQCSELCGTLHAFMPLAIRVVSKEQYEQWAVAAQDNVDDANAQLMASIAAAKQVAASETDDEVSVAAN
ncbi:cytochrome c oxidase subunit II [Roseibium denhamense]|uniref:Cytochrome c oxidase subunit 2 n=2 Tax=Roseibium denhamense TaxID=76305 RepID=A0ABY1P343_9HYPH|nr:cytochrome c oxidase subunit 2 [Roseibium denhamense]